MDGDLHYPPSDQPCVLMVNADNKAYDWRYLKVLCEQYDVEFVEGLDDYQETFDAVLCAIGNPKPKPTLESVDAKATEAKTTADEAKTLAEEATKGSNPQTAAFAAMVMPSLTPTISDSRVAEIYTLLPGWEIGKEYVKGECFEYEEKTFRTSQTTTAQEIYPPGSEGTLSLYYEIVIAPDGIIVWAQPRGEFDAPDKGDLRHFPDADGPVYRSLVDGNAYSPEAYPQNWEKA